MESTRWFESAIFGTSRLSVESADILASYERLLTRNQARVRVLKTSHLTNTKPAERSKLKRRQARYFHRENAHCGIAHEPGKSPPALRTESGIY